MGVPEVILGFRQGYVRRKTLNVIMQETAAGTTIHTLDLVHYRNDGICALALDFDGVLAHHGAPNPLPDTVNWLQHAANIFGEDKLFILSNKPTEQRRLWFAEHFPEIRFVSGVAKKPNPDGVEKIRELAGVPLSAVLMIDDRLLTGCLAALNAGSCVCWINKPTVCYTFRPMAELFFMLLRKSEQIYLRLIS